MNLSEMKRRLAGALRAGVLHYFSHPRSLWTILLIPFMVFLTLVLSVGPHLQYYVFSFLNKDAASLYDSAFPDGLADFPTPTQWLIESIFSWLAIPAIIIAIWSFKALGFREIIQRICLASFVVLTAFDLLIDLFFWRLSLDGMLINVASNFIGAFLIAGLSACAMWIYEFLALEFGPLSGKIAAPTSLIVVGCFVSLFTYLVFYFFYQPTPVRLEVRVRPPISGWFAGKSERDGKREYFQFVRNVTTGTGTELQSVKSNTVMKWRKARDDQTYNVSMHLFADCPAGRGVKNLKNRPFLKLDNVKTIDAFVDAGYADYAILPGKEHNDSLVPDTLNSVWITPAGEGKVDVEYYVTPRDTFRSESSGDRLVSILVSTFDSKNKTKFKKARNIRLNIDGKTYRVHFPSDVRFTDKKLLCRPVDAATKSDSTVIGAPAATIGGILVSFEKKKDASAIRLSSGFDTNLTVSGISGWMKNSSVDAKSLDNVSIGRTNFSIFSGKGMRISIDNKTFEVDGQERVSAIGSLKAEYEEGAAFHIVGKASATWYGERRLNPTKWERLPDDWQRWLLAGLGGLLFALFKPAKTVAGRLRADETLKTPSFT